MDRTEPVDRNIPSLDIEPWFPPCSTIICSPPQDAEQPNSPFDISKYLVGFSDQEDGGEPASTVAQYQNEDNESLPTEQHTDFDFAIKSIQALNNIGIGDLLQTMNTT